LIHFKCCPEEKWYPCHKCHNAAVALIENPNDEGQENDRPSEYLENNNMAREISAIPGETSSNEAEVISGEHEGHQVQECGSASDLVEDAENPGAKTSNDPHEPNSEESEADTDGGTAVKMGDEIDSRATQDVLPPSPPETKTMHSAATALDGTQVHCTGCGQKQKEENKAAMEETEDNCNSESKSYCPHYERDTCLIHCKCCPEEKRYPCHKCHNAAVALIENPNGEGQENDRQTDHIMATEISNIPEERSSNVAGLISEQEGHQVQECGSAGDLVEDPENPVAEPSNDPEPNSEESDKSKATDGGTAVNTGDKIDSGATQGFLATITNRNQDDAFSSYGIGWYSGPLYRMWTKTKVFQEM